MTYKTETVPENFKKRVDGVVTSGKSIRANIQELFQFATVAYLDPVNNGNLNDMTYLFKSVAGVKSLAHKRLFEYGEDTLNIRVAKTSDGEVVVRKAVKGEAPSLRPDADLSAEWWEHGRAPADTAVDILKVLRADIKKLESTQGDEAKKALAAGQETALQGVINKLSGALAWAESEIKREENFQAGIEEIGTQKDAA